jgi:polyferredoxin
VLRGLRDAIALLAVLTLGVLLPASTAIQFRQDSFYAIADIRILEYFVHPPIWWSVTGLAIVGLSLAYGNVWCRWICPLGAIYSTVGLVSATNVVRDEEVCTACGKCAKACPNRVPVNTLRVVRASECDGCQTCVAACPEPGALGPRLLGKTSLPRWSWPLLALALWLGIYAIAMATGHWQSPLPAEYFRQALVASGGLR